MIHAILYVVFIIPFTAFLRHELRARTSLKTHMSWVLSAVIVGLIASFLSLSFGGVFGNFLLHAIGGGVASTLLFVYVLRTLKLSFAWTVELILLFGFVSGLGILNELAEYAYELLNLGIMSIDTHDTWRDFVANSSGALAAWLIVKLLFRTSQKQR